ncbi:MAG TPA: ergothioneine biosynthesis protein EgtB [Candidatus Binatia bacterium]|nr:ergothioneine biosynthesis protein EgtB [Candidatus Binatia bacterium]
MQPRARPCALDLDDPALARAAFAQSIVRGLSDRPRRLSCRWLYDARGSALFERITAQPEYYLTRTEARLLEAHAPRIRELTGPATLVELGCGTAAKTRHLLRAWTASGRARYVGVDVDRETLRASCAALGGEFPRLEVRGIAGTYEQAFPLLRDLSPLVLLFLGSSVGNLDEAEVDELLDRLTVALAAGDHLLLGIDLVKDARTLEAAYNDAAGVSAAFSKNLFARMNRELGTRLDLEAIEHVAYFDAARSRIEIWARFTREAVVALPEQDRRFRIAAGEMVLVEVSRKFDVDRMLAVAARHGFAGVCPFVDPTRSFALLLLRRREADTAGARRRALRRELEATRAATLELIAPLDEAQRTRQHCPLLSPVVWDLGHVASYEAQWVATATGAAAALDPRYDPLAHPRGARGTLPLGDSAAAQAALAAARAETLAALARAPLDGGDPLLRDGSVFTMIAQHEAQHAETILQAIQLVPDLAYEPPRREEPAEAVQRLERAEAVIPAGPFVMGTDDRARSYDNERPAHVVELPRYRIDVAPVTNGEYLRFMGDGGYRRRELWTDAGWLWLADARVFHPAQWVRLPDGAWGERTFGRVAPLALDRPVVHVSWFEAAAYARWAGKRLPTEAEWEKAAAWDLERGVPRRWPWGDAPPTAARANLGQRTFAPAAVGAHPEGQSYFGCHQMVGDVWEWTASDFAPYPGFEAFPYPEYSAVHFGRGHKVLRGGSWATQPIVARCTFRNWDLPQRRQIFAGFRCARDA